MNTFLISDTHFSHINILSFLKKDGTKLRDFNTIQEMDEIMINNWNSVVNPKDKVYHIGDVAFANATRFDEVMSQLNGTKVLIKGNHDNWFKPQKYLEHFKDIRSLHVLDKIALAHIPLHPDSLSRWRGQIHGHVHSNSLNDPRYYNVSVEVINYTPVSFDLIRKYFNAL